MRAHAWYYESMPGTSNYSTLFDLIGTLSRRRFLAGERAFGRLGFNHTEARLLTLLDGHGGRANQDLLSNSLSVDRSNAGRALKNLEQSGMVRRSKDVSDARTNLVQLTAKGRRSVAQIAKARMEMAQTFFGEMTEEQAGQVIELFKVAEQGGNN